MKRVRVVCEHPEAGGDPLSLEGLDTDLPRMLSFMKARGFTELLELWEGPELEEKIGEAVAA